MLRTLLVMDYLRFLMQLLFFGLLPELVCDAGFFAGVPSALTILRSFVSAMTGDLLFFHFVKLKSFDRTQTVRPRQTLIYTIE